MPEALRFGPPVISIDVEDWPQSTWDRSLPITERAARSTRRLLGILRNSAVRTTMFVLGKFADAFPDVVRDIHADGHEVASHGYGHVEVFKQSPREFRDDVWRSKDLLEGIIGTEVSGYRAPDFSVVHDTLWALPILAERGFRYDSSIYPIRGTRYGIPYWPTHPVRVRLADRGHIIEAPIATLTRFRQRWPVGGGGYHRLLPGFLSRFCASEVMRTAPFVLYCHPYEFDPSEFRHLKIRIPARVRLHQGLGRRYYERRFSRFVARFGGQTASSLLASADWPELDLGPRGQVLPMQAYTHESYILGISAYYHDSAACLLTDGEIVAAAQEERFSRVKHDPGFPTAAVAYCLRSARLSIADVKYVVFYDKPLLKFDRLLETYLAFSPRGLRSFLMAMPVWLKDKLLLKQLLQKELADEGDVPISKLPPILFAEHHESHAASAFFPSPFEKAAVLCMDGVGEWATTSAWLGDGNRLTPLWEIPFPHSLGMLYSAFTYYTGFKVNSGEYKVMGLAPYGRPAFVQDIYDHLIDLKPDGTFRLNIEYLNYCTGLTMTNGKFSALFGGPPREPESPLTQREMDLARSIQDVTEEVMLRLTRSLHRETGADHLCLAGGVALNCVGNGRILRDGPYKRLWVQPAAGDAGGAVGAAMAAWHQHDGVARTPACAGDAMKGAYLGPSFTNEEIEAFLTAAGAPYVRLDEAALLDRVADALGAGNVVGWLHGRMEFGPRALGGRSILGDPRNPRMQSTMNLKIKFRESFRPFAPSVLRERVADYFDADVDSPYMLLVASVLEQRRSDHQADSDGLWGIERLNVVRSDIPAVTHIDYSARIQTVHRDTNPRYYALLKAFEARTGCAVLVNASFNVRGKRIVCSPQDAYRCFMRTGIDTLVLENCVLEKAAQPPLTDDADWRSQFSLD